MFVLVVEDSPEDVFLVMQAMEQAGLDCELQVADDGEKALGWIERAESDSGLRCPNLVLLDLNIPKRTGDEVLARVRRSPRLKQVPVVVMTSSESQQDQEHALALGATEYFRKPSDLNQFMWLGTLVKRLATSAT